MFVCVVAIGTFVVAPAELGELTRVCGALHRGADLAQREGGGGDRLRLERQQPRHERQERVIQREWGRRSHTSMHTQNICFLHTRVALTCTQDSLVAYNKK